MRDSAHRLCPEGDVETFFVRFVRFVATHAPPDTLLRSSAQITSSTGVTLGNLALTMKSKHGAFKPREERPMSLQGRYEPSPSEWVRDQVELYERTGGTEGNTLRDTGLPVIVVTTRGNKSGMIRKTPLMRVEHDGEYALVASQGGAPTHPVWYYNLLADPESVMIQDGPEPFGVTVREAKDEERTVWWARAVEAFPPYAQYQLKTDRRIPVFIATKRS
jgi:deazaflavin-dependent oxidoreductase (nitroreductase family)